MSAFLRILRHASRLPQVPSAMRETPDWWPALRIYALGGSNSPLALRLRDGKTLDLQARDEVASFWQIFVARCYDVRPTDRVIIDAGGNVGLFALFAAMQAPQARIISVEPHPDSIRRLRAMIEANGLQHHVELVESALGGDREPRRLQDADDGASTAHYIDNRNRTTGTRHQVACMTLADLLDQANAAEIDLLKMDIESSEYETLLAAPPPALRRIRRMNVELHVPGEVSLARRSELLRYLDDTGFQLGRWDRDENDNGIAFFTRGNQNPAPPANL